MRSESFSKKRRENPNPVTKLNQPLTVSFRRLKLQNKRNSKAKDGSVLFYNRRAA
jgi:hypothetical protein